MRLHPPIFLLTLLALATGNPAWGTYSLSNVAERPTGFNGTLTFVSGTETCPYGMAISPLFIEVTEVQTHTLRVKVSDPNNTRWEVPDVLTPDFDAAEPSSLVSQFDIAYETSPFRLILTRIETRTVDPDVPGPDPVIWESGHLYFADQYVQWGTALPAPASSNIYGLGERVGSLLYAREEAQTYSFLASDQLTPPKLPLYGSHPYYLDVRPRPSPSSNSSWNSASHGVFLLNSNPMDVVLASDSLTYKSTGGILDLFFFAGPTPSEVTRQYQAVIGRPHLPPLWALGYHQCRWGYDNWTSIAKVADMFEAHALPLDVLWSDIDYMDKWKMFTFDPEHFAAADMKVLVDGLHAKGKRFVPIIDPGVYIEPGYEAYEDGLRRNVFVRDPTGGNFSIGKVWPGLVHYPDWTHPNASAYWNFHIQNFYDAVAIDGLWTDMNEVASFCDGRCLLTEADDNAAGSGDESLFVCNCSTRFDTLQWDDPPYQPLDTVSRQCRAQTGGDVHGMDCGTLSMAARYHGGRELDLHNLYGHLETKLTSAALAQVQATRPFVLTRSSFPGTGVHAAHWLGDNHATWHDLWKSGPGVLNFNLFGIPLVGSDVCGFTGDTTPELCSRWMQAGAFYPFFRNHNHIDAISQEPYALGDEVLAISRAMLRLRYALLPYWYSLFFRVHVDGGAVARPLFYQFPDDPLTFAMENQSMIGEALLVSPALELNQRVVRAYFPQGTRWFSWHTGAEVVPRESDTQSTRFLDLETPLDTLQLHVRGGCVVPLQTPGNSSSEQRAAPYHLLVSVEDGAVDLSEELSDGLRALLGRDFEADLEERESIVSSGRLVLDDGISIDTVSTAAYNDIAFVAVARRSDDTNQVDLDVSVFMLHQDDAPTSELWQLDSISLLGWACPVSCVSGTIGQDNDNDPLIKSPTRAAPVGPEGPTAMHFVLPVLQRNVTNGTTVRLRCACPSSGLNLSPAQVGGIVVASVVVICLLVFCLCRCLRGRKTHRKLIHGGHNGPSRPPTAGYGGLD